MNHSLAVLGPAYSHSHLLAKRISKNLLLCQRIEEVFSAVAEGKAEQGIVPLESRRFGTVRESILSLLHYRLKITKAYNLPIIHCLAAQNPNFKKIASHAQALGQCTRLLQEKAMQQKQIIECLSTSQAMQLAARNGEIAAIGAPEAAKAYGLRILKIAEEENETKFICIEKKGIGKKRIEEKGVFLEMEKKKILTGLILNPKIDRSGLLFHLLAPFATQNINLVKIESLPTGKKLGSYLFYLELQGSVAEKNVQVALDFLKHTLEITILGSYEVVHLGRNSE